MKTVASIGGLINCAVALQDAHILGDKKLIEQAKADHKAYKSYCKKARELN